MCTLNIGHLLYALVSAVGLLTVNRSLTYAFLPVRLVASNDSMAMDSGFGRL